jgi:BirA family biotin operon repressor/biotin-[acetyl-CoA-carboxylase] ligase
MPEKMSKLDVAGVQQPLSEVANAGLERLEVFSDITSTNTYLMSQTPPSTGRFRVAIADHQTSGRGRHYRRWISAPGAGVYLSFAYTFASQASPLGGLTLAIGVGVIGALRELEVEGVSLKWPNDIVANDSKLGGILTEVQAGKTNGVTVVTGIGLNVDIADQMDFGAESDWAHMPVDLKSIKADPPGRERIAATLINNLYVTFRRFQDAGLAGFMDEWQQLDWLLGREITVELPDKQTTGIAAGIGEDGTLLVDSANGRVRVLSGSIIMAGPRGALS